MQVRAERDSVHALPSLVEHDSAAEQLSRAVAAAERRVLRLLRPHRLLLPLNQVLPRRIDDSIVDILLFIVVRSLKLEAFIFHFSGPILNAAAVDSFAD